jgi:hypothetical protein
MEKGEVRVSAVPDERASPDVLQRYLGVDRTARA